MTISQGDCEDEWDKYINSMVALKVATVMFGFLNFCLPVCLP